MSMPRALLRAALSCAALACAGMAASAAPQLMSTLAALGGVEPGMWQVRAENAPVQNICLADPAALTQVRHGGSACARLVIADARGGATVHYSCPGAGWGRTTLRVSSAKAIRIDTQGIADNAPFAFVAEARRTGDCPAAMRASMMR